MIINNISINLEATHWWVILLSFVPFLINVILFIYSYYFINRKNLTILFSNFLLCLLAWQIGDTLLRITDDINSARIFYRGSLHGILLVPAVGLHFTIRFFEAVKPKYKAFVSTLIYGPTLILILLNLLEVNEIELVQSLFGFINISTHPYETLWRIWLSSLAILTITVQGYFYFRTSKKNHNRKNIALLLLIGYAIPTVQGITTQTILPVLLDIPEIPLTTTFITCFSIASILALKKYKLFDYSPVSVSDQIMGSMNDGVVISNREGQIQYVNNALCEMLNYEPNELLNKTSFHLLPEDQKAKVSEMDERRFKGEKSQYETKLKTKEGKIIDVLISSSPFYDDNDNITGSLGVLSDITSIKDQNKIILSAVLEGEEQERKRLAQELHDGIAQYLTAINMNLDSINEGVSEEHEETLSILKKITKDTIIETRALSHNLLPKGIEKNLHTSLKHLLQSFKTVRAVQFSIESKGNEYELSKSVKFNLFRIAQEFLNNSIKHSKAKKIDINIHYNEDHFGLILSDDGIGFDINDTKNTSGIGLINIKQRVEAINGVLEVKSSPQTGTSFKLKV